jgi:hypothetical protein
MLTPLITMTAESAVPCKSSARSNRRHRAALLAMIFPLLTRDID